MEIITERLIKHLTSPQLTAVLHIQSTVLYEIQQYFREQQFTELPPVIISPLTDPLAHGVHAAEINYEGQRLSLTKSMIFHKQLSLLGDLEKIFIISPNVRLEKSAEAKERHLLEFQQVDFEIKQGTREAVYQLMEELLQRIVSVCLHQHAADLVLLGRTLLPLQGPFPRITTSDAKDQYGPNFEEELSKTMTAPFWLESFYREFYDKEDPMQPGQFINYDLIYPEGFGEGLSGAEREFDYGVIKRKMAERRMDLSAYSLYLDIAQAGLIPPSAGAGFGMQRLLRYLTGIHSMESVVLFPRSPRTQILF